MFTLGSSTNVVGQSAPASGATVFRNVRVFDGERMLPAQDVLVENGSIARVGRSLVVPAGASAVDGTGRTLLPGLIDAHTHSFGDALQQAVIFGVTTTSSNRAARLIAQICFRPARW
jgi:imidazolonepropionase-like amidohydrolase